MPLDLNGTLVTALTRTAYERLRDYLGLAPHVAPSISSREMDTVRAQEDLLRHYQVDTRPVYLRSPLLYKGASCPMTPIMTSSASVGARHPTSMTPSSAHWPTPLSPTWRRPNGPM